MSWFIAAACLLPLSAAAQQQQTMEWATLPPMQLERQFAATLQDTLIQRWRDPVDGTICYIYLPIRVVHSPPTGSGYVQYGPNTIGSMSCVAAAEPAAAEPTNDGRAHRHNAHQPDYSTGRGNCRRERCRSSAQGL